MATEISSWYSVDIPEMLEDVAGVGVGREAMNQVPRLQTIGSSPDKERQK